MNHKESNIYFGNDQRPQRGQQYRPDTGRRAGGGQQRQSGGGGQQRYSGGGRREQGGFQAAEPLQSTIPSPYNFVPLSEFVFIDDEWTEKVSHDIPFSNGVNGVLTLKATAESLIYIRNGGVHPEDSKQRLADPNYLDFFRVFQGGPYGIPGSSIKGMIRNVVEIASFSKMALVDDHRYSIRDLNNQKHYTGKLTQNVSGAYKPRAKAGWLEDRGNGEWVLFPCKFGRVEQGELARYHAQRFEPWKQQKATEKYKAWLRDKSLEVNCQIGPETRHSHGRGAFVYHKVTNLGAGTDKGIVVLTGQPAGWNPAKPDTKRRKKHMEFVFFNTSPTPVSISQKLKNEFIFVHSEPTGEPNDEWKYWKQKMQRGERVPVFFLGNSKSPDSMGLAMMYRLPYKYGVVDAIRHTSDSHCDTNNLDFAQCLFGRVEDKTALRSRVWFRPMVIKDDKKRPESTVTTILNSPKPTYYPNYIEQKANDSGQLSGDYQTFMDENCRIRGWKRYPTRTEAPSPITPSAEQVRVSTSFKPLPKGTVFVGQITVHNLRPEELGAIVWAIRMGDQAGARHSLGMAKPYGFGQVTLNITDTDLQSNNKAPVDIDECVQRFRELMNQKLQNGQWENSPQIQALLNMADPQIQRPNNLKYPILGRGRGNNHFVEYTRARKVLPGFVEHRETSEKISKKTTVEKQSQTKAVSMSDAIVDDFVELAVGQPLIMVDLKNAPQDKLAGIKDRDEFQKELVEAFIKKYPDKMSAWKSKFEKNGKGVFSYLVSILKKHNIEFEG